MDSTKYSNIKLIISSVDGIFTNDKAMYDYDGGIVYKEFLNKDFIALSELRKFFNTIIISNIKHINKNVFEQKGFKFYYSKNKKKLLKKILIERNITPDECIYVGYSLLDLPCIRLIPCSFCPTNAFKEIKNEATVLPVVGGDGVIYELYKMLNEEMIIRNKFYFFKSCK